MRLCVSSDVVDRDLDLLLPTIADRTALGPLYVRGPDSIQIDTPSFSFVHLPVCLMNQSIMPRSLVLVLGMCRCSASG